MNTEKSSKLKSWKPSSPEHKQTIQSGLWQTFLWNIRWNPGLRMKRCVAEFFKSVDSLIVILCNQQHLKVLDICIKNNSELTLVGLYCWHLSFLLNTCVHTYSMCSVTHNSVNVTIKRSESPTSQRRCLSSYYSTSVYHWVKPVMLNILTSVSDLKTHSCLIPTLPCLSLINTSERSFQGHYTSDERRLTGFVFWEGYIMLAALHNVF